MIPDIVCDDLPEIVFSYRGLRMIQKVNRYEIVEDGQLLAVAKVPAVAERLFFYRALAMAGAEMGQTAVQQAAFTAAGKQAYFSAQPEAVRKTVQQAAGGGTAPGDGEDTSSTASGGPPSPRGEGKGDGARRFKKPTVEEIDAYCEERGNGLSGQAIHDHYESNGWMVGRTKMKDWKAAVRTWEQKEKARTAAMPPRSKAAATNPEQSSLDNQALEKALLNYRPVYGQKQEVAE